MIISHPHSQYKFYKIISFTSRSAIFKFTKRTQIFRKQYVMDQKTVFSALQICSAYENRHSRIMGCFCKDHSCINTTDPLTGRRELRMHRYVAVTGKRVRLKRQGELKTWKIPSRRKDLMATCSWIIWDADSCLLKLVFKAIN